MLMPQGFINKSSMTPGIGRRTPNRCKKIGCGKRVRHCLQSTRRDSEANKYVTVADFLGISFSVQLRFHRGWLHIYHKVEIRHKLTLAPVWRLFWQEAVDFLRELLCAA